MFDTVQAHVIVFPADKPELSTSAIEFAFPAPAETCPRNVPVACVNVTLPCDMITATLNELAPVSISDTVGVVEVALAVATAPDEVGPAYSPRIAEALLDVTQFSVYAVGLLEAVP